MRIIDNTYKIGEKVLVQDYDNPMRWEPAFIAGMMRSKDGRSIEYWISDDKEGKYLSDGWPEDRIMKPNPLYHDDADWEKL